MNPAHFADQAKLAASRQRAMERDRSDYPGLELIGVAMKTNRAAVEVCISRAPTHEPTIMLSWLRLMPDGRWMPRIHGKRDQRLRYRGIGIPSFMLPDIARLLAEADQRVQASSN